MFSFESLIFLLSSLFSFVLIYYKIPTKTLQQIIIFLLIVLLIFLKQFIFSKTSFRLSKWPRLAVLFLAALFVQLVVISTGGLLSPFLILLHLFTLGTSFLLNLPASVIFLVFSLMILSANVWFNQNLLTLFKEDPFSPALYLLSFIVIIPLIQMLNRSYYIKDALSRILSENLHLGQQREKSILQGLTELVLVTDENLKILSINQAVEKIATLSTAQIIGHFLPDILPIKYKDGSQASLRTLSIPQMLEDRTARIINDFSLDQSGALTPITIQARPIADLKGKINQFVFVLKEGRLNEISSRLHKHLDSAHAKHQVAFEEFEKTLSGYGDKNLKLKAELLRKIEEDLWIAQEIEDHPILESNEFPDVAEVCKKALESKKEFADSLGVPVQFVLPPGEVAENALLSLKEQNAQGSAAQEVSGFGVPVDPRWLQIILEKLLDIAILLSSGQKERKVEILVYKQENKVIYVDIAAHRLVVPKQLQPELLTEYFGQLGIKTNLRLGSGLEGFIAQTVAKQLKIPLTIKTQQYPDRLIFRLELSKDLSSSEVNT